MSANDKYTAEFIRLRCFSLLTGPVRMKLIYRRLLPNSE